MNQKPLLTCMIFTLTVLSPGVAEGQIRGSERGQVSQEIDGTTLTIDYGRPHVRGRLPVFGGLIPWGHVWTPGANWATTLEVSKDIELNGVEVSEGRYSLWMIPSETEWEVVLDPNDRLYHTQPPEVASGQIRFNVTPETAPFAEALTFDFPLVQPTGGRLQVRWATTAVLFDVAVQPSAIMAMSPEEAAPYPGTYEMAFEGPAPPGAPPGAGPKMTLEVSYQGDRLVAAIGGGPPDFPTQLAFIVLGGSVFNPGWMRDGEVFETEVDMFFEFAVEQGKATGFDVRGLDDRLMMRGRRTH